MACKRQIRLVLERKNGCLTDREWRILCM
jgi:hypothetical protein